MRSSLIQIFIVAFLGLSSWYIWENWSSLLGQSNDNQNTKKAERPPTAVDAKPVRIDKVVVRMEVIGNLKASDAIDITTEVSGIIKNIKFKEGEIIEKDQILLVLDYKVEQAKLDNAIALTNLNKLELSRLKDLKDSPSFEVEAARAKLNNARAVTNLNKLELSRLEELKDSPSFEVEAAKAALDNAQAITNSNRLELNRLEGLKSSPAFNAAKFEDLQSKMVALKANEAMAKANLNIALQNEKLASHKAKYEDLQNKISALLANEEIARANLNSALQDEKVSMQNLDRAEVKASFDGIIESREIELGEAVGLGFTLFTLVSDTMFEIEVDVPANRARALKPNEKLMAETSDNIKFPAIIRSIGVKENSSTRTLQVRLSFEANSINRFVNIGESITVSIPIGPGIIAVTVHKDAILKREGLSLVYILKDGVAQIKPVELGDGIDDRFVVKQGLAEGDEVVIKGNERLRPGQKINSLNNKDDESNE